MVNTSIEGKIEKVLRGIHWSYGDSTMITVCQSNVLALNLLKYPNCISTIVKYKEVRCKAVGMEFAITGKVANYFGTSVYL